KPYLRGAGVLERAVVLRSTLEVVLRALPAHRKALELERREIFIETDQLIGNAVEQALTVGGSSRAESALIALVGNVGEVAVRAHRAAVRAREELVRVVRVRDNGVHVRVDRFGVMGIAVHRQVAPRRTAVGRKE